MKLFYRKYGSGPPLVILHGLYGSSDNWVTVAKKLGESFTVYLPDQRNHGQSPHHDVHDYESMRDDVYELVTDLGITKFFLAGHSMGGKTASAFAIKWPEMLNGLLVADITPFADQPNAGKAFKQHMMILEAMSSLDTSGITSRAQVENALKERITSPKIRGFIMKNLHRTQENRFYWKINVSSLLKNLDRIMGGIDRNTAFSKQVHGFPVIFLRGSESDYLRTGDYEDIKRLFPSAEIIEIKNAGHWLHADQPEAVIGNFLKLLKETE